jgi:hypothetical protein
MENEECGMEKLAAGRDPLVLNAYRVRVPVLSPSDWIFTPIR